MGEAERNGTSSFKGCSDVPPPCSPNPVTMSRQGSTYTAGEEIEAAPVSRSAPDLETLLAAEVGIDRDRMMAGRLRDDEWPTLITAHDRLAARLPAGDRPGLNALVARIDAAGQEVAT